MSEIPEKFLKPYDAQNTEDIIYKKWLDSGYFNPDNCVKDKVCSKDAEKFSIMLPPPNVTGILHIGHASMLTIEDIMVRYNRMTGKKTVWIPGTDHAAIATQSKVEKLMQKEKLSRHDLGREKFLKRVNEYAQKSHDTIVGQVKKMGASIDWSREAFTLDDKRNLAVKTAFKQMYNDGLIYRGNRVVNWDPKGQTVISDDEIVYEATKGTLYTFKYSKDFPITIATTRPETKVGDTAVAVHPDDKRYKQYVGKEYDVEFCGVPLHIKIVADHEVDPEYGSGAVGVTPAHSMVDFLMAQRHDLPVIQVINEYAKMMVDAPDLNGKKTSIAREVVVEWLNKEGLMEKEPEIFDQNISRAERSNGIIEPLPKLQWFIDVNKSFKLNNSSLKNFKKGDEVTLKSLMHGVVEYGDVTILPDRFNKTYYSWIDNLRPWCISRQIWYGHQIPVWYKKDSDGTEQLHCDIEAPKGDGWVQDSDTLDTWFSSGLWTFSTLGWPNETEDFKNYHPTNVLETGYDILFFWVARMILMSTYLIGDVPFEYVYLQGLVRDAKGRKISKSLGNNVDPIEIIEKFSADSLRMSLIVGAPPGNDTNYSDDKVKAYKKFANKIWNASRFVVTETQDFDIESKPELLDIDLKYIEELNKITKEVTENLESFKLYMAADGLYHYFWHTFADIIIEECKTRIASGTEVEKQSAQYTLWTILTTQLKLIHPFMPFVTEEIWSLLPNNTSNKLLMIEKWPE